MYTSVLPLCLQSRLHGEICLCNRTHNSYASSSLRNTNNTQTLDYVEDLAVMSWRFQGQSHFLYLSLLHTSASHTYTLVIISNPSDTTLSIMLFFFNLSDLKPNKTAITLNILRNIYMPNITYKRGPA